MEIAMMEMTICDEVRTVWWCGLRFAMAICDLLLRWFGGVE
ncbi:hypothetical protein A2U01_0089874, partial [Trifolium medium]|nr:hypothetical protein [Trifolium medium]